MVNIPVGDVVVVIPAYRAETVVDAALASVAGQRLMPRQVVLVDDGSDDSTAERALAWKPVLPIVVLSQPNSGPAAARRRALAESDAPLVALLDVDDVWLPDHLETLVAVHGRVGGIVSADAFIWRPGRPLTASFRQRHPIPSRPEQRLHILEDNFVFVGSVFARADYDAVGGFRDGFTGAEDWDLWARMLGRGSFVTGAPGPTVLYRLSGAGLTNNVEVYDRYLAVLAAALDRCTDERERRVIARRQRWYRGRRELDIAYASARAGHRGQARRHAVRAWAGSPRMALESAALLVGPGPATRLSDGLRDRRG